VDLALVDPATGLASRDDLQVTACVVVVGEGVGEFIISAEHFLRPPPPVEPGLPGPQQRIPARSGLHRFDQACPVASGLIPETERVDQGVGAGLRHDDRVRVVVAVIGQSFVNAAYQVFVEDLRQQVLPVVAKRHALGQPVLPPGLVQDPVARVVVDASRTLGAGRIVHDLPDVAALRIEGVGQQYRRGLTVPCFVQPAFADAGSGQAGLLLARVHEFGRRLRWLVVCAGQARAHGHDGRQAKRRQEGVAERRAPERHGQASRPGQGRCRESTPWHPAGKPIGDAARATRSPPQRMIRSGMPRRTPAAAPTGHRPGDMP
jgi:hypothetical protein